QSSPSASAGQRSPGSGLEVRAPADPATQVLTAPVFTPDSGSVQSDQPGTSTTAPVIPRAASEARKTASSAMSAGLSQRDRSASGGEYAVSGVSTAPGQITLTAIPRGRRSRASARLKPMTACLEAQ